MKVDVESYPRYDKETVARKIRAVTGKAHNGKTNLTNSQFRRVMDLCEREYRIRRLLIISSRTMMRIEIQCYDFAESDRLRRQLQAVWKRHD